MKINLNTKIVTFDLEQPEEIVSAIQRLCQQRGWAVDIFTKGISHNPKEIPFPKISEALREGRSKKRGVDYAETAEILTKQMEFTVSPEFVCERIQQIANAWGVSEDDLHIAMLLNCLPRSSEEEDGDTDEI